MIYICTMYVYEMSKWKGALFDPPPMNSIQIFQFFPFWFSISLTSFENKLGKSLHRKEPFSPLFTEFSIKNEKGLKRFKSMKFSLQGLSLSYKIYQLMRLKDIHSFGWDLEIIWNISKYITVLSWRALIDMIMKV